MCQVCALTNPYLAGCRLVGLEDQAAISEGADAAGGTGTAYTMQVGDIFSGTIDSQGDRDWVGIDLSGGETYDIALTGIGLSDPYLRIYDSAGTLVDENDDSTGLDSFLSFTPASDGTYYVAAASWADNYTGSYQLSVVDEGTPPPPPPPASNSPLDAINWQNYTAPTTLSVYFVPGGETVNEDGDTYTTGSWDNFETAQAMQAFEAISDVANVTFDRVTDPDQADFMMIESPDATGALGYWGVGGGTLSVGGTNYSLDGWGVFNSSHSSWSGGGLAVGGYGYVTLIHEIGHGMGMAHPHDTGGGSEVMNGVTGPFGSLGDHDLNQGVWTTMSYNDGWQTAPHGTPGTENYGYQATMMALDIAVLQDMYGANTGHKTGDDTYTLPDSNGAGTYYSAIWDAGGTDTIVHSGSAAATIDLRPATLAYESAGGGHVSYVEGIHGGFTIAEGVTIENASGGSGNDEIIGNGAANTLRGNDGDDILRGGGGADRLIDGAGADHLVGNAGDDEITLTGTRYYDDRIVAHNVSSDSQSGTGARIGLDGKVRLEAVIDGGTDIDTINLGAEGDAFFLHDAYSGFHRSLALATDYNGNDSTQRFLDIQNIFGLDGDDIIDLTSPDYSLAGASIVVDGGEGADILWGSDADETLHGGPGDDTLFGGIGTDRLFGDAGADTFQFTRTSTDTHVMDFDPDEGDRLQFFDTDGAAFDPDSMTLTDIGIRIAYEEAETRQDIDIALAASADDFTWTLAQVVAATEFV